ncbi:MAG: type II toxin-antitoxin system YafQ family toxin [Synergistales bacterium]|nr:type II toxin-antitoxin system YafQ family toxin [Dethiosulfovibrio sp.]NCC95326.1 type II toxin-antitoxin system YafQ family toxin [Synergistales bacterium]
MPKLKRSSQFKRDVKLQVKRGKNIEKLKDTLKILISTGEIPTQYNDHPMLGNWGSHRSIHIEPDWILIYKLDEECLSLIRTGTHSDILKR